MSLLHEYIRKLLVEQDEEERTVEQKLRELFLISSGNQALELAKSYGEVDPELVRLMEDSIDAAHTLMTSYLYYTEAYAKGDFKEENSYSSGYGMDLVIAGDGEEQRLYHFRDEITEYRRATIAVFDYRPKDSTSDRGWIVRNPSALNEISLAMTKELFNLVVDPSRLKGDPKQEESWQIVADWAGPPS